MNSQERISKLQGLLERIQRNAEQPRAAHAAVMAPPATATPIALTPAAAAPPAATPIPPAVSAADRSVDELLGVAAGPSEPPVDVEVSLESFAPPPVDTLPLETGDAEPIPLVSVTTAQPEPPAPPPPPPADDTFGLDSEVSEVRITSGLRDPSVEVTVAAIEAEAEPIGTEELSEEDLVEVTEEAPAAAGSDLDIDFEDEEEQPPASSQRSKVATSMDEALAAAAAQLEAEREVPIKTPPPESGPQETPAQQILSAPPAPDVDALLGSELEIPTRESTGAGPTPEQLGQTIDLEEARGPSLELAEPPAAAPSPGLEELEVALPGRDGRGGYDDDLLPPPEARDELEAHRRRMEEEDIPPPPESLAQLPSVQPGPEIVPVEMAPRSAVLTAVAPEVVARPLPAGSAESFGSTREVFAPRSFAELLDASLALNGE